VIDRNVELYRGVIEAFNARDIERYLAFCDPSIEWHSTFAAVGGAVYHGHDGLRRWHRDLEDTWGEEIRIEPETFFHVGEHVLTFAVLPGAGGKAARMSRCRTPPWRGGAMT
jgi:hypothetical protein